MKNDDPGKDSGAREAGLSEAAVGTTRRVGKD